MDPVPVQVVALLVAPVHAYAGRPDDGPAADPTSGAVARVRVRAQHGIEGDRYAGAAAHRTAAVTVISADALDAVAAELGVAPFDPLAARRNIVVRGPVDVDALARRCSHEHGAVFALDTGAGPVRFQAHRPASPCRWMDVVLADGAWRAMRGRGGVRCTPLDDGVLTVGPGVFTLLEPPG
ncbi:MOSC domain-containing protein [Pseudonocardia thermophila]|uniref:MOSC domain-containing protein n=1 Tax=Pseudonocardia thermophila TaxID=1848 RepID=UPI0009371672|nr:MOSC domain-containing protein [Pseudonocardia thermophila]